MSDDEHEIEAEDAPKHRPAARIDDGEREMSEAEKLMAEKKIKQEEEEAARLRDYEEQRRIDREKEEEELRQLKEKQERRRQEREEEERLMAERKQEEEERRLAEEAERRKKIEAEKAKKDEEKKKRLAMMQGLQMAAGPLDIPKKDAQGESSFDKFGNIVKAKSEMGMTKEQHEEQKRKHLHDTLKDLDFSGMDIGAVKAKVKELHQRISRLEADRYDLEKRHERQQYDLKELNERQRQISRNKALKKGLDPNEVTSSRHPPKVAVLSKYDRQIDRRSFKERRNLYEVTHAIPHFPNCPPPVLEMEKVIKPYPKKEGEEDEEPVEEEEE